MTSAFPFGLPGSTALYLCLYVLTLAVHAVFISYVLAGSGYMAVWALRRQLRGVDASADPMAATLRDWLPFALGVAITAGVAPLLFVQILYKHQFYTANLLLFHRWMAIVPVLMAGFYLLYLAKSKRIETWRPMARTAVAGGAFACFVFIAYSFAENHLLALQDQREWVRFYAEQRIVFTHEQTPVRVGLWLGGALPVFATVIGWQLCAATDEPPRASRVAGIMALAGIAIAAGFAALYWSMLAEPARRALTSAFSLPYAIALLAGLAAQLAAWAWQLGLRRFHRPALLLASVGAIATITGIIVVRESLRLATLGSEQLFALHERAATAGGMPLFIVFLAGNGAVIAWCFMLTRRGLKEAAR